MLNFTLRNRYWPIALDIGADSVKMLQLRATGNELSVSACGRWKVPPALRHDPGRRRELTIAAVRDMLRSGHFKGKKVATALSCEQLGIKNVRLPRIDDRELCEAVKWEAAERFSFEIAPDGLKYLRAGEVRQGTETQDEIILIAVDEDTVDAHLEMLDEMGLDPQHIGAEPVELFRVFERRLRRTVDREAVTAILDMGCEATRVVVARGRQIVFIKSIDIGGSRLTEAAAKQLNLSVEEAGELRSLIMSKHVETDSASEETRQQGGGKEVSESVYWTIHDAVRGELEALGREIALCLRYCSVTFRGLRAERIILTGGQAYDPSVVKLLSEQLGIECVIGQPLQGISLSGVTFGGNRRGMLSEWTICAGLSVRFLGDGDQRDDAEHEQRRLSA